MNSKLRFLGDGMAGVYVKCYFSRLRSTSSALLGLLNPDVERETTHFGPNPPNHGYIMAISLSLALPVQLLTKKRLIFLAISNHSRMDLDEVDSIVDLSLCEAVKRFDPFKGASFMTFLFYHLKGNLVRAVTDSLFIEKVQKKTARMSSLLKIITQS